MDSSLGGSPVIGDLVYHIDLPMVVLRIIADLE
jgi:hypothetical protein